LIYKTIAHYLRIWDVASAERVDSFIANSENVANRIKSYYNKPAKVIYPPVNTEFYHPVPDRLLKEPYYLVVSALVPYKRVDLAVETFNQTGNRLLIIGVGPEKRKLQKMANDNVSFMGWEINEKLRSWYSHCEALIFPGEEDFGIVPVEVQACGRPVIAYAKGGAIETVVDRKTGVLFKSQKMEDLLEALQIHSKINYNAAEIIDNAKNFSEERFLASICSYIDQIVPGK
jgi:glycosyltransferase involved in cell wall biosynthesis